MRIFSLKGNSGVFFAQIFTLSFNLSLFWADIARFHPHFQGFFLQFLSEILILMSECSILVALEGSQA